MAWHGGATGNGVRGLDSGLIVGGKGRPDGRVRKRRRRRGPTFSVGRPDHPYSEEKGENWDTPPWGQTQLRAKL